MQPSSIPTHNNMTSKQVTSTTVLKWVSKNWIFAFAIGTIALLLHAIYFIGFLSQGSYPLDDAKVYLADKEADIYSIQTLPEEKWRTTESFLFSDTSQKVWLRFEVPAKIAQHNHLIRFNDPLIDNVEVYVFAKADKQETLLSQAKLGDTIAFKQRLYNLPHIVVPVDASNNSLSIYVAGSSNLAINLSMGFWSSDDFIAYNGHYTIFFGAICGFILALMCYSLMMFATARKPEYMWFCAYLIGFFLHLFALSGFGYQYIWPDSVSLQGVIGGTTICLTFLFQLKFSEILIAPNKRIQKSIFRMLIFTGLFITLLSVLTFNVAFVKLSFLFILITSLVMSIVCFSIGINGAKVAKFLGAVWLFMLMGVITSLLHRLQLVQLDIDAILMLVITFYTQTLLIGSALIHSYQTSFYNTLKLREAAVKDEAKAIEAKDQILALQKDAQIKLEAQVKAQTQQLEGALSKLSRASVELEQLRNIDGLTGLPNRLAFDEAIEKLAKTAMAQSCPLQLAVIDIDHFKKVNDTYGHLAGDECLRVFSKVLKEHFHIDDFAYCRYGGEEFVLASLLPLSLVETELNAFKDKVEALKINANGTDIHFTTSAGVAGDKLNNTHDIRKLYAKADEKLYLAKQKGRNLVIA